MPAFVSPEGCLVDVPESRAEMRAWATDSKLIKGPSHYSNLTELLDPASGDKQLQHWVPLPKLQWVVQINKKTKEPLPRPPQPVLGGNSKWFCKNVAPMIVGMEKIRDGDSLTKALNGKLVHYGGWMKYEMPLAEARAELLRREAELVRALARHDSTAARRACTAARQHASTPARQRASAPTR